jgi:hypothetical protein
MHFVDIDPGLLGQSRAARKAASYVANPVVMP